jgi:outer membrane protein
MKKHHIFFTALTAITIVGAVLFGAESNNIPFGVVNFTSCITDSKLGKQEQGSFENLNKQMSSLIEDTNKQLQDVAQKLNNSEYLDGLSPEAEKELREKYATLGEELNRYQGQFYQVMNQANMRLIQSMTHQINTASEKVAKAKKLNLIVNKDAVFFYDSKLDITPQIIAQMDKTFDEENKKEEEAKKEVATLSTEVVETEKKAR